MGITTPETPSDAEKPQAQALSLDPAENIHNSLKGLLKSQKFSDLTIRTVDQVFKVHKLVICSQSEYFARFMNRLLNRSWKETAGENLIILKDDHPRAVEAMIQYMYEFDFKFNNNENSSPMLDNVLVYRVADKYSVPALKNLVEGNFKVHVGACWDSDDFSNVITEVYSADPQSNQSLRDTIVKASCENIKSLLKRDSFNHVLEQTPRFAADVMRAVVQQVGEKHRKFF